MDPIEGPLPEWYQPLSAEIARELDRLARTRDDHKPALEQEAAQLQARLDGWAISLAKPDLAAGLREDLERNYNEARERLLAIRSDLAAEDSRRDRHQHLVDPRQVLDRLRRLDEVLASGNPARGEVGGRRGG
jgi:hypothetical protein